MTTKWMACYVPGERIIVGQVEVVRMATRRAMLAQRYEVANYRLRVYSEELRDTKASALATAREHARAHRDELRSKLAAVVVALRESSRRDAKLRTINMAASRPE